ncbi:HD domain-containing protein [Candidatus Parcubacteria bacterium]|nr:MAG: HD domain-containing protein [Candidatus Parcubacteria bacterium]
MLNLSATVSFIALLLYCVLLVIVIRQVTKSRLHLSFAIYLITMVVWSFGSFMIFADLGLFSTLFWNRFMLIGSLGMPVAFFGFAQTFLMKDRRTWIYVGFLSYLVTQILNLLGLVITNAYLQDGLLYNQYSGEGIVFSSLMWAFFVGLLSYDLFREYRNTHDTIYRNRLKYLLLITSLTFVGGLTNITKLQVFPVDIAFNAGSAILIAYTILRHHFLDINVVVRKGLLYSIPTVIIGAGYFLVISLALRIFDLYSGLGIFTLSLLVAILTALLAQPLRDKAQSWIDRLFFREKYDSGLMLQRLSSQAASILDLDIITNRILMEITTILHIEKAAFLLKREDSDDYYLTTHKGMTSNVTVSLSKDHPIVLWFSNHDRLLTRYDLSVAPQFKALWGRERDELEKIEAELFIPLKVKKELVGVFALGAKRSEEGFSQDDQLTLTTLANQVAVTIENARLYTAEQHRREELDTLYDMARILVVSNDLETVLTNIAQHTIQSVHATFVRILTLEKGGGFLCRTAYPIRDMRNDLGIGKIEPLSTKKYYQRAISLGKSLVLEWDDSFNEKDRHDLFLDLANSLCISPLLVGDELVGLLVLGETRRTSREPFDPDKLKLVNAISDQAASALRRATFHEQLEESFVQTVLALAKALDARDSYTQDHSQRMAALTDSLCQKLGIDENQIQAIRLAAALHDIGKIGVPDEILRKPGPLTSQEWELMKRHPKIGADIIAPVAKLVNVAPIILAHQEKFDGSGYPYGLKGEQIPMGARVLAVVDAYVAITDERVYRKARSHEEAIAELVKHSGSQFDPAVVDAFVQSIGDGSR